MSELINCNVMCSYYAVFGFLIEMCFDHLYVLCITVVFGSVRTYFFWVRFKWTSLQLRSDLERLGTLIYLGTMETWRPGQAGHVRLCSYRGSLATQAGKVHSFT
jgi:hypothetical protein